MRVRDYKESDAPYLKEIYDRAGYDFPFPDFANAFVRHVQVVVDEMDVPLMAAAAKLVPEIILICAPGGTMHPLVKLKGIAMIHQSLRETLTKDGHDEAFAFVPPEIDKSYGRHLMKKFGWLKTWAAYRVTR